MVLKLFSKLFCFSFISSCGPFKDIIFR